MSEKHSSSYREGWQTLYLGEHTITREEYMRRTENSQRPYHDEGIQKHDRRNQVV